MPYPNLASRLSETPLTLHLAQSPCHPEGAPVTGTGRDHSFQEIRPVRALQTPAFELAEVTVPSGFAEHDRRLEELAQAAAAQVASRTELLLAPLTEDRKSVV